MLVREFGREGFKSLVGRLKEGWSDGGLGRWGVEMVGERCDGWMDKVYEKEKERNSLMEEDDAERGGRGPICRKRSRERR